MKTNILLFITLVKLLQESVEKNGHSEGGQDGRDGVPDTEDGLLLIIWPGEVTNPALELDQQ